MTEQTTDAIGFLRDPESLDEAVARAAAAKEVLPA